MHRPGPSGPQALSGSLEIYNNLVHLEPSAGQLHGLPGWAKMELMLCEHARGWSRIGSARRAAACSLQLTCKTFSWERLPRRPR